MVNPHSCQVNPSHVQCQLKAQVTSSTNKALTALWGKFPIQLPCFRLKTSSITRRLFCCACAMHLHWLHTHGAHGTFLVTTSHCWSFLMADVETEKSPLLVAGVVFWVCLRMKKHGIFLKKVFTIVPPAKTSHCPHKK